MSSTNRTPHYNLSQFTDTDKPTWRGDINADMSKIDTALNDAHTSAVQAVGIANAAKDAADTATTAADAATEAAKEAKSSAGAANAAADAATTTANGSKTVAEAAKTAADAAVTTANAAKAKVDTIGRHNIVILGDSWTLVESYAIVDGFREIPAVSKVWSIGQGGATIQKIQDQLDWWAADTTIDHSIITDVVIVAGINNVYRNLENITEIEAYNMAVKIVEAFGNNVKYHYFPNNSKTTNEGRNARYMDIIQGFIKGGITVHPETLYLTGYNHQEMYRGTDEWGTYHLSSDGYKKFAKILFNLMEGSHIDGMIATANVEMSPAENSDIVFSPQICFISYTNNSCTIKGSINNCSWREGISEESKKNPNITIVFKDEKYGENLLPFRFPPTVATIVVQNGIMVGDLSGNTFATRGNSREANWSVPYINFNFTVNGNLII